MTCGVVCLLGTTGCAVCCLVMILLSSCTLGGVGVSIGIRCGVESSCCRPNLFHCCWICEAVDGCVGVLGIIVVLACCVAGTSNVGTLGSDVLTCEGEMRCDGRSVGTCCGVMIEGDCCWCCG